MAAQQRMSSLTGGFELNLKLYDANTIVEKLNRLFPSLQLSPVDIQKPASEIMCDVYQQITQYIMDIPDAVYTTPPIQYSSPQEMILFTQGFPKVVIFRALSAIVEDISSNEVQFSLLDLIAPAPNSTRILLSTLINFIEFTEEASAKALEIFNGIDERKKNLALKRQHIIDLSNEVQRVHNDAKNLKRLENEEREKLEILEHNIKETHIETEMLQDELNTVSKSIAEYEQKLAEMQSEGKRLTFQNEVADRDIVNSPDRLQGELNELTKYLENVQKEISAARRQNWEYKEKQKKRVTIARAIEHAMEMLSKLHERQKQGTVIEETLAEAEEQRTAAEDDCREIERKLTKETNKLHTMEKEFEKEEMLHKKTMKDIEEHLATINEQVKDMRRRVQDFDKENVEVQREIGKVKNEISTLNRTSNAEMRNLAVRLEEVFNKYLAIERMYEEDYSRVDNIKNILAGILNDSVCGESSSDEKLQEKNDNVK